MRIVFVGSEDECAGFKLAGLETLEVSNERQFLEKMAELIDDREVAVIVVSDGFFDIFAQRFSSKLSKRALPSVVFVPSFEGLKTKRSLKEFLANVLGVKLQ